MHVWKWRRRVGITKIYGCVFKERGNQKIQFFEYLINDRPVIKKRLINKLAKQIISF